MAFDEATLDGMRERLADYVELEFGVDMTRGDVRCLNPAHEDKSPSMHFYPSGEKGPHLHCFGSCDSSFDVFDAAGWAIGSDDFKEQVRRVAAVLGVPLDDSSPLPAPRPKRPPKPAIEPPKPIEGPDVADAVKAAFWALFVDRPADGARKALEVLRSRGFSDRDIQANRFGWVRHPEDMLPFGFRNAPRHPDGWICLPFPNDDAFSSVRRCVFRPAGWENPIKEYKQAETQYPLWREYLLSSGLPRVAVAEGVYDAASITAITGLPCVALMGSGGPGVLESVMAYTPKEMRPGALLIATDDDKKGREFRDDIARMMAALGQPCESVGKFPGGAKDPNEMLMGVRLCA